MDKPNLFKYASKELSQDAIISWLLQWADPKYNVIDQNLHKCGQELIKKFFDIHGKQLPIITNVEIKKQSNYIDILCVINDEFVIIIEDKKGSKEHSNQLIRYIEHIKKNITIDKIIPIYFQTHEQSDYTAVEDATYRLFTRDDFLIILNSYNSKNCIFSEYKEYLHNLNEEFNNYKTQPIIKKWSVYSWQGFYKQLQNELQIDVKSYGERWKYEANQQGGYWGFSWYDKCFNKNINNDRLFLHINQKELCIKLAVEKTDKRSILRNSWSEKVISICTKHGLKAKRPHFGYGQCMTVAILDSPFPVFDKNQLDMGATLKIALSAQAVLDECVNITI